MPPTIEPTDRTAQKDPGTFPPLSFGFTSQSYTISTSILFQSIFRLVVNAGILLLTVVSTTVMLVLVVLVVRS